MNLTVPKLMANKDFKLLWDILKNSPKMIKLKIAKLRPVIIMGAAVQMIKRSGGYDPATNTLTINPEGPTANNPVEFFGTLVHELIHAALDVGPTTGIPGHPDILDWKHDPKLTTNQTWLNYYASLRTPKVAMQNDPALKTDPGLLDHLNGNYVQGGSNYSDLNAAGRTLIKNMQDQLFPPTP